MEIVNVTENANFARVRLGDIRPNRFRNLDRWPLEQEVLDKLKQSIHETGFWNNLQAIENERGEIELRFGHHRLAAGLELFGPDYEAAIEIVPYRSEWNLQRALLMENSIGRNKIMHTHEVVHQLMHWWDDVVFEKYPTWFECIENDDPVVNFNDRDLELYFGKQDLNGPSNYSQCVKYGIGSEVITKMLSGAETQSDIKEALASLEPTTRRKRGLELKAAEERAKAEAERAEAERIKAEQEAARRKAEQEAKERQAELDRIAAEQRRIEEEARNAKAEKERQRLANEAEQRARDLEAKKKAAADLHERAQREHKDRQKLVAEKEAKARQAESKATQKEQSLNRREWYDARASEVFGNIPSHAAEFRRAVSSEVVRPYLETENLVPFAKAIQAKYGEKLTAQDIRKEVNENFREFKKTLKLKEKEVREAEEKENPALRLIRLMDQAITDLNRVSSTLFDIEQVMKTNQFTSLQGPRVDSFREALDKVSKRVTFYHWS